MQRWIWATALIIAAVIVTSWSAFADVEEELRTVAKDYLAAYARNDYAKIRPRLPVKDENLFGPYLFEGMPTLQRPKVDDTQALVEFTCKVNDPRFPQKGGILLKQKKGAWLVRQVLFFDRVPVLFNLPKRSKTDQDRKHEPVVADVAQQFLKAWQRGDTDEVLERWHRWMDNDDDVNDRLSFSNYEFETSTTKWGEHFAHYKAKLTYRWGILSYTMKFDGGFIMVKENDRWKVRGNVMVLYF